MIITDRTPELDEFGNYELEFPYLGIDAPPNATPEYIKQLELADQSLWMERQIACEYRLDTEREWAHERERLLDGFIENIMQNPHYRIYKAGDNFIIYERYIQLSWTLEEYIRYIFEEVGGRNPLCGYLSANKVCERYFSKQTPIVEGGIDDKNNGLSEAKAFQLMYAEVGGGSVNINLLANLTRKQLNTAHLDYRTEEGHVIDVWLNKGEYANLAGGFEDEKVAAKILYYIKPKSSPKDRKDLKVDDLTVFEFRPDLS